MDIMGHIDRLIGRIDERIAEIKRDERLGYPPASVFENAPLALIQSSLKARIDELERLKDAIEKERDGNNALAALIAGTDAFAKFEGDKEVCPYCGHPADHDRPPKGYDEEVYKCPKCGGTYIIWRPWEDGGSA